MSFENNDSDNVSSSASVTGPLLTFGSAGCDGFWGLLLFGKKLAGGGVEPEIAGTPGGFPQALGGDGAAVVAGRPQALGGVVVAGLLTGVWGMWWPERGGKSSFLGGCGDVGGMDGGRVDVVVVVRSVWGRTLGVLGGVMGAFVCVFGVDGDEIATVVFVVVVDEVVTASVVVSSLPFPLKKSFIPPKNPLFFVVDSGATVEVVGWLKSDSA